MRLGEMVDVVLRSLFALGVPGAGVWYLRERRKSRAADDVAEQTVPDEVRISGAAGLTAHINAVERAFEVEREAKDRRIADQDQQIAALTSRTTQQDTQIQRLTDGRRDDAERITALRDEVRDLKQQVQLLMSSRLTDHPKENL